MQVRVLVEGVEDDVGRDRRRRAARRPRAKRQQAEQRERQQDEQRPRVEEERVGPAAIRLREREAGHVLDLRDSPSASRRRRAARTRAPRPPPARVLRGPIRSASSATRRSGEEPVRRPHDGRVAEQRAGGREPHSDRGAARAGARSQLRRARSRAARCRGARPTSTFHWPFSHALGPASGRVSSGQTAKRAAAATPTARRPVARRPMYAVATTVTAFAASESAKPDGERDVGVEQADDAEAGRAGSTRGAASRRRRRPLGCWSEHERARRERDGETQPTAIAVQLGRSRQTATAPATRSSSAAAPAGPNETEISSRDSA